MSHRGYTVTSQIRERKRKAAQARQAEYDKLSLDEKIAKLPAAPAAARQRARLLKLKAGPSKEQKEKKKK